MIYKLAVIFSILFIVVIIKFVKNDKLDEKYSLLWLFFGIVIFIISVFPGLITKVSTLLNVYYPPSLLLLFAIIILGIYIIHISLVITKQNKMIVKLNQELGILKEKVDKENKSAKKEKEEIKEGKE